MTEANLGQLQEELILLATTYGLRIVAGFLILIVGWVVAGWLSGKFRQTADRTKKIDPTITPVLAKAIRVGVLVVTVLMVMSAFGIETTSLIAVLGAAGLAVGLALQGTLSNVASGLMVLSFRPFEVGDTVEVAGTRAVVDEIGLMLTKLHTPDNVFLSMPNSEIWGKPIRNYSRNPQRRIDMVFGIGYGDDMARAVSIINDVLEADGRVLTEPASLVAVAELADSSVNIYARPWVQTADYLPAKLALTRRVKERFDQEGISIPFPQRDIHVFQESPARVGVGAGSA